MAEDWLEIQVDLGGARAWPAFDQPPGRVLVVGPGHSFSLLGLAIDQAFARWNLVHDHLFELADGRRMGLLDERDPERLDDDTIEVCRAVGPGDTFGYTFDLAIEWRHRCTVLPEPFDPVEEFGDAPPGPIAVAGWGWIPDQYGRATPQHGLTAADSRR